GALVRDPVDDGHQQFVAVAEALVEVPFGQVGVGADRGHGGAPPAPRSQQVEPGFEQLLAAVGAPGGGAASAIRPFGCSHINILTVTWITSMLILTWRPVRKCSCSNPLTRRADPAAAGSAPADGHNCRGQKW